MKKNKSTIILILVFFVGLSVMLYPTISDYVNQRNQSRAVASYAQDVDNMTDADYSAYFEAADAFNAQVAANETALYRPDLLSGYNETLDITGTGIMGYITISKIGVELPIYHGTSDSVLQIAAGHLEGTSLPVGGKDLGSLCFACLDEAGSRLVVAISCVRSACMGKGGLPSYAQEEREEQCGVNAFSVHDLDELMNIVIDLFGNGVLMLLGGRNEGLALLWPHAA